MPIKKKYFSEGYNIHDIIKTQIPMDFFIQLEFLLHSLSLKVPFISSLD